MAWMLVVVQPKNCVGLIIYIWPTPGHYETELIGKEYFWPTLYVLIDSCKQKLKLFRVVFTWHVILICAYVECNLLIGLSHKLFVCRETENLSRARNMHDWLTVRVQECVPRRFRQAAVASTMLVDCSLEHLCCRRWRVGSDHDHHSACLTQSTNCMMHATNLELFTRHMHATHQHIQQSSGLTCCCKWLTDRQFVPDLAYFVWKRDVNLPTNQRTRQTDNLHHL